MRYKFKTLRVPFSAILCALIFAASSFAHGDPIQGWLADVLPLRLTDVGPIHEDTVDLPDHILASDFVDFDPSSKDLSGVWVEAVVWRAIRPLDSSDLQKMLSKVDNETDVWRNRTDPRILDIRRSLPDPTYIFIIPRDDGSRLHRYYCFWPKSGLVSGGFCREAGEGMYQESPQAKQWLRHLPGAIQLMTDLAQPKSAPGK